MVKWAQRIKGWLALSTMRKRLGVVLAFAFLPTGVMAVQSGWLAAEAERRAVFEARLAAEMHELGLAREAVGRVRELVRVLSANPALSSASTCGGALGRVQQDYADFSAIVILSQEGRIVCAADPALIGLQSQATDLIATVEGSGAPQLGVVMQPILGGRGPVIGALARLPSADDTDPRFIGASWPLSPLLGRTEAFAQDARAPRAILSADGSVIASAGPPFDQSLTTALVQRGTESAATATTPLIVNGVAAVAMTLQADQLYLVRGWSTPLFDWGTNLRLAFLLLTPILLWAAALGAAWFAVEIFCARPVHTVERLAKTYAYGGNPHQDEASLSGAPVEVLSLQKALGAMFGDLRERERQLAASLEEERALLREVNHRVRNNLQMIASILSIQARAADTPVEAKALSRAQERVQLLALAFRRIYGSGEVRRVALDELAREVVATLLLARQAERSVRVTYGLSPVAGAVNTAAPFCFLVGECLSQLLDAPDPPEVLCARMQEHDRQIVFEFVGGSCHESSQIQISHKPTTSRLITAFARQIGAIVLLRPESDVLVRIVIPSALPE